MQKIEAELLDLLKTVQGSGAFAASGAKEFTFPGLYIQGVGEVGFPMIPAQVREIISQARKAPFGKGGQTVTDTTVRSAWEIDADRLSFRNSDWERFVNDLLEEVKQQLGIENKQVSASLYKLLIYEQGDFFLAHKDSEKEKGMFATLVVGLPSAHTGGKLTVRFDGRSTAVDFSSPAGNYQIPYVAFYADCEHEIEPVESGYRVCLVYNLLQVDETEKISGPQFGAQVDAIAGLLRHMVKSFADGPIAILLDHQYTPANFSLAALKRHDRPRAEALIEAARQAGYFAKLGLVTYYQMGELEDGGFDYYYNRRRRYYDYDGGESTEGTMGEIYEQYTSVEHWSDDGWPGLGEIDVPEENILTALELGEEEPLEKEAEGYTGNAGMTMQYWYHYGAVFLWPRRIHAEVLANTSDAVQLQWLDYYIWHWDDDQLEPRKYVRELILDLASVHADSLKYNPSDFSPLAGALIRLNDEDFLQEQVTPALATVFVQIDVDNWTALLQHFPPALFEPVFEKAAGKDDPAAVRHLLSMIMALDALPGAPLQPFVRQCVERIPEYLDKVKLPQVYRTTPVPFPWITPDDARKEAVVSIIEKVLALSRHREQDEEWVDRALKKLIRSRNRLYTHEALAPVLLSGRFQGRPLAQALRQVCVKDLQRRTKAKPAPPPDWRREVPPAKSGEKIWEFLRPFLESPSQKVFDYQANQSEREVMERVVGSVKIDLKMETIKSGRPYTLRLTKTQAAYEEALRHWEEDLALLERLGG